MASRSKVFVSNLKTSASCKHLRKSRIIKNMDYSNSIESLSRLPKSATTKLWAWSDLLYINCLLDVVGFVLPDVHWTFILFIRCFHVSGLRRSANNNQINKCIANNTTRISQLYLISNILSILSK